MKASSSSSQKERGSEVDPVLLEKLRRAKLVQIAARIRQCGLREQHRRCGCGAELDVVLRYCHHYLCPACQRRKAYRISKEVEQALVELRKVNPGLKVFFGTFTLPSCEAEFVGMLIDTLNKGFAKFLRSAALKKHLIGAVRFNEVRFNLATGMFQPHIHALVVVRATYMSKGYLSREVLLAMWQRASNCPRVSQISFTMVKPDSERSLSLEQNAAALVRYSMKPVTPEGWTPAGLATLATATRKRRLCEFLGEFRPIRQRQRLGKARCFCGTCSARKAD